MENKKTDKDNKFIYDTQESKERHKVRIAAFVILRKDEKIFLIRRKNTSFENDSYFLPSGHLEKGETLMQAAIRECLEETNAKPFEKSLKLVHVMHRISSLKEREYIDFFFLSEKWENNPTNNEPEKSSEAGWYELNFDNLNMLPNPFPDFIKEALKNINAGIIYSEYGWK